MRSRTLGVLFLMAFCLSACPIRAQEAPERQPARLEPVVVTAGRVAEKPTTVTQAMTVIPREEIEKHQYQDMGDLLRNYGIQVDAYTPNQATSTLVMRGARSSRDSDLHGGVLVLMDGRRTGTNNISLIPLVNVERIEIIRGPASVQYGSSAIGGAINIITRRGGETPKLSAEGGYGSWNTTRGLAEGSTGSGPFDFSGGASYLSARDYRTHTFDRYPNTGTDQLWNYSFNGGFSFLDEHRLGATAHGVDGQRMGSPGDLTWLTPKAYTSENNHSLDLTYDGGHKHTGLAWKTRYYTGDRRYEFYDTYDASDPFAGSYNDENRIVYQGAQGQLSFTKDFLTLTGGLDWQRNDIWGSNDNGKGSMFFEKERHASSAYEVSAGFLLAKLAFLDDLIIVSGGLRHDKYSVKARDSFTPSGSREFDHTTPSVGLAVNPVKWLTLRGNYGESYQAPTPLQLLGGSWSAFGGRYIGNPDLRPEKGTGWDTGVDLHYRSLNLGLTYFSTDYEDKIGARPVSGGNNQYYNVGGTVYYRGIEAQAGYDIGEALAKPFMLRQYANLTRMLEYRGQGQDPALPDSYAKMRNVSDMNLAYGLQFKYPDIGLEADLRATYYGYRNELVYDSATWTSELEKKGGETVVDFFIAKTLHKWEGAGRLSLKGEVRNIGNVKYEATANYPLPGRSFWLGLRYDY